MVEGNNMFSEAFLDLMVVILDAREGDAAALRKLKRFDKDMKKIAGVFDKNCYLCGARKFVTSLAAEGG
jgi:hypothetical protein